MASEEILRSINAHMERNERFLDAVVRRLDAQTRRMDRVTDRFDRQTEVMTARFDEITAEFRDVRDERRGQTQALLRLLDRLSGGGEQPGPATG